MYKNVKKTFEILSSEITSLMDLYISLVPKSVRACVCACVCACACTTVMFLVNASSPKPLDVATANSAGA